MAICRSPTRRSRLSGQFGRADPRATAAVLDEHPRRALVFLKRHSKRYLPSAPHHLLHALALNQEKKRVVAQALLERHGLTEWAEAYHAFAGRMAHYRWLLDQLDAIMGREQSSLRGRRIWGPRLLGARFMG